MKFLFLILCLILSIFSYAKTTYTVGVENIHFLPYSDVQDNKYTGVLRDILDDFAKEEGIKFDYRPLPIKRLYFSFFTKKIDFKLPANEYWKKETKNKKKIKITYSDDIIKYIDGTMVFHKKDKVEQVKKLGIVSGFTPWGYQDLIKNKKIQLIESTDSSSIVKQVALGRLDGFYANIAVINKQLDQNSNNKRLLSFAQKLPNSKGYYKLATIDHKNILEKFNLFLKKKRAEIIKIEKEYGL